MIEMINGYRIECLFAYSGWRLDQYIFFFYLIFVTSQHLLLHPVKRQCCQIRDLGAQLGFFSLFLPRLASISGPIEING